MLAPLGGSGANLKISPPLAPASSVDRLRRQVAAAQRRNAGSAAANAKAIRALGRSQAAAIKRLTAQQLKMDAALTRRYVSGDAALSRRFGKSVSAVARAEARERRLTAIAIKRAQRRTRWNEILLLTAPPLFAAYGDRGRVLTVDNFLLTTSLFNWMVGDEVLDGLAGVLDRRRARRSGSRTSGFTRALRWIADGWSYFAPFGFVITALGRNVYRQQERFITGVSTVRFDVVVDSNGNIEAVPTSDSIDIPIADWDEEAFEDYEGVVAVVTLVPEGTDPIVVEAEAEVVGGRLVVTPVLRVGAGTAIPAAGTARVAWMVDTRDPEA